MKPPLGDVSSSSSSSSDSSSGSGSASDSDSSTVSSSTSGSSSSRKDDTKRTEKSKSILKSNSPTISESKGKNSKNINRRESRILDNSVEQTSKLGNNIRDEAMSEHNKNPNSNRNSVDWTRHLLRTVITNRFNFFEKHSERTTTPNNMFFRHGCSRSSYEPIVLFFKEYSEDLKELVEFANINHRKINLKSVTYKDMQNANVTIIPMRNLVTVHDNFCVYEQSKLELPSKEQIKDVTKFVYECCFVDKIWTITSESIRTTLMEFFSQTFVTESDHIQKLLNHKKTFILMIINKSIKKSNKIEPDHIIAAIIFSTNERNSIGIDFIATGRGFYSYGYGTLIIHMAQIFGRESIKNSLKQNKVINDSPQITTYLACRNEIKDYYLSLGFTDIDYTKILPDNNLKLFVDRFNMDEWSKDEKKKRLNLMKIDKLCPRMLNKVSVVDNLNIEGSIYNREIFKRYQKMSVSKKLKETFKKVVTSRVQRIKLHPEKEVDADQLQTFPNFITYLKRRYLTTMFLPIGQWFNECFNDEIPKFDNKYYLQSQTNLIACEHLQMQFFPEFSKKINLDRSTQWVCVRCSLCQKKVFVRKTIDEKFVTFMLKVIYSVWFHHIFSYKISPENEFMKVNQEWNICPRRRSKYLQRLRDSTRFDISKLSMSEDGVRNLYKWKKNLEFFLFEFKSNFHLIFEGFIFYQSTVHDLYQSEKTKTQKRKRSSLKPNYTEEHVIGNDDKQSRQKDKEALNFVKQKKRKQNEIKQRRHLSEAEWNQEFYKDLQLQNKFDKLEYVRPKKVTQLHSKSIEYLTERETLKKNDYKNKWGEIQKENHFLAYLEDGSAVVVDDNWFKQRQENGDFSHYTITKNTFDNVKSRFNRKVSLNKNDKNKIKKHVDEVLGRCEIQKIERYKRSTNECDRFEHLDYLELKQSSRDQSKKSDHHKYISYSSSSRYDYRGKDMKGRYHFLSKDWIELNFKRNHKDLFKDICQLAPGEHINIPAGNRDKQNMDNKIPLIDIGPANKFIQDTDPSCLFTSLANAFVFVGFEVFGQKLIEVYYNHFKNKGTNYVTMNDVLKVTNDNAYHCKYEKKFKFQITKEKHPNAVNFLNMKDDGCIYHCVLSNHHAIAICNNFIFDPVLKHGILLKEKYLRLCAEVTQYESTSSIIHKCYKYSY